MRVEVITHALQWLRIYCSGQAQIRGRDHAVDQQAEQASHFGRVEVLRRSRNFLRKDKPEHHNTDRMKEKGV